MCSRVRLGTIGIVFMLIMKQVASRPCYHLTNINNLLSECLHYVLGIVSLVVLTNGDKS
jgi:hypothetical protein